MITAGQIELGKRARPPVVVADAPRPIRLGLARGNHRRRAARRRVLDPSAIEQVDGLRAQLRELAVGQALHRPGPRHPRVSCLELELHAAVRRHAGWGHAQHIGVLERRKRRVVVADEAQLRVRQTERRQVELRAVLEPEPLRGIESRELSVVRVDRPGPPRPTSSGDLRAKQARAEAVQVPPPRPREAPARFSGRSRRSPPRLKTDIALALGRASAGRPGEPGAAVRGPTGS